jgi:tRNA threonylcarbamoyladenosine biosynthesis protein TsaB
VNLLAIETSSRAGAVALLAGGALTETIIDAPREQGSRLLPAIDALLDDAGVELGALDAVAFGCGPGSFTGVRLAAAFAQGLGLSRGLPLIAVSSLAVAAQRAWREHGARQVLVCVDARMDEVYSGLFTVVEGLAVAAGAERLGVPADVTVPAGPFHAVGDGFAAYADALGDVRGAAVAVDEALLPSARDLAALAQARYTAEQFVAPAQAVPVYLRDESAWRR